MDSEEPLIGDRLGTAVRVTLARIAAWRCAQLQVAGSATKVTLFARGDFLADNEAPATAHLIDYARTDRGSGG